MKRSILLIIIATAVLFSCIQGSKSEAKTVNTEAISSVRRYDYTDSMGKRVIIHNSLPRGGGYIDPDGKKYLYAVFYTQITNETIHPIELKIDFPSDSLELPLSSGNYMKICIPSDTMTLDKASLTDYGLPIKAFLDSGINKSYSLKRTINPKESTAFYVVMLSNKGVDGTLRTGLSLKGQNLFYKISAYKSIPGHPLMDEKDINCGSINLKNLMLRNE
ncbi:MAG TPA: hypothetical protein VD794_14325 [Flavisolibacter sp.]|nr:hypothetical protein [Flavisolibacter sp.]